MDGGIRCVDEVWCSQYSVYVRLIWTTVVLIYIKPTLNHFSAVLIGPKKPVLETSIRIAKSHLGEHAYM